MLCVDAVSSPRLSRPSSAATSRRAFVVAQELPEQLLRVAEHALDGELVPLARKRGPERREERVRSDPAIEHLFPERDERGSSRQRIGNVGQVRDQIVARSAVEDEISVADAAACRKDVVMPAGGVLRPRDGCRRLGAQGHVLQLGRAAVAERHFQALGPQQPARGDRILLAEATRRHPRCAR